jgi:hypothetical protein
VRRPGALALVAAAIVLAGCGSGDASEPPADDAPLIATFDVVDETYRILLTDPADIAAARLLQAGEDAPSIPNGLVIRGDSGVNDGYSWSIDPDDVEFADATVEVCDGLPSDVEAGIITSERYCPWSAVLIALEPAP